jgi:hypothetical protein
MFPDTDLDRFVDALAIRIASFDKSALSETKRFVDMASLLPGYEIAPGVGCVSWIDHASGGAGENQGKRGFHQPVDVEIRLGYHVGQLGTTSPRK